MGLRKCGIKMTAATQFIDFFVHDILDFSVICKDESKFNPNNSIFNIKNSI